MAKKEQLKRLKLTEEDFRILVTGDILKKEGVEIILADIGFNRMHHIINLAATACAVRDVFEHGADSGNDRNYFNHRKDG